VPHPICCRHGRSSPRPDARDGLVPSDARRSRPLLPRAVRAASTGEWGGDRAGERRALDDRRRERTSLPLIRRLGALLAAARRAAPGVEVGCPFRAVRGRCAVGEAALASRRGSLPGTVGRGERRGGRHVGREASSLRRMLERRVLRRADAHVVLSSAFAGFSLWSATAWLPGRSMSGAPESRSTPSPRVTASSRARGWTSTRRRSSSPALGGSCPAWASTVCSTPGAGSPSDCRMARCAARRRRTAARTCSRAGADAARRAGARAGPGHGRRASTYRCADVAVVPTVAVEGFGLVVLEAAACGTRHRQRRRWPARGDAAARSSLVVPAQIPDAPRRAPGLLPGALPTRG
jgi:hypothetical protein